MTLLTFLGLSSAAFVTWFTWYAYRGADAACGKQTRREAIIEVWIGIVIGFVLNWLLNWVLLPMVGAKFDWWENVMLGSTYTAISILRGYAIRRWAETHIRTFSIWLSQRLERLSVFRAR